MKHVLKRLSDGLDNHSVSVTEVVNFIGPKDVYYDTCDIQLTVIQSGALKTKLEITTFFFSVEETKN